MPDISFALVQDAKELHEAFDVRRQVFVREQGIPESIELDEYDEQALHILVTMGVRAIGTARVLFPSTNLAKIERMAVLKAFRRRGIGRKIIAFLEAELINKGMSQEILHAQYVAIPFYESCGFQAVGLPFWEAGIKHIKMHKTL